MRGIDTTAIPVPVTEAPFGSAFEPSSYGVSLPAARAVDEVKATVDGRASVGQGSTFRLRPRWPSADQLDYVNKFSTAALLLLGLVLVAAYAVRNPGGAVGLLARGAAARAGVR